MTTGTGITSNVGGPQIPTPQELEATAATQMMKVLVGIMGDSLDKPFSQIDADATWKYKSSASNPTIPTIVRVRVSQAPPESSQDAVSAHFNRLVDLLPADLKALYIAQAKLPPEERSPAFNSLDNVLGLTANFMLWLEAASKPMDTAAVEKTHIPQYKALTDTMSKNLLVLGGQLTKAALNLLQEQGHALPGFDQAMGALGDLTDAFGALQAINQETNPAAKRIKWLSLASKLDTINEQLTQGPVGKNLKALQVLMEALSMLASAASLEGSGALLISLSHSSIGLHEGSGATGVLPDFVGKIVRNLSQGVLATLLPHAEPGSRKMLPALAGTLLAGALALEYLGKGEQKFDLELGLSLMAGSEALQTFGNALAAACGAKEGSQNLLGEVIVGSALLLIIHSAARHEAKSATGLSDTLNAPLQRILGNAGEYADSQISGGSENQTSKLAQSVDVRLQAAKLSLDQRDYDAFISLLNDLGKEVNGGSEVASGKKFEHFVDVLNEFLTAPSPKRTETGVISA